jgi:uncharacterized protein
MNALAGQATPQTCLLGKTAEGKEIRLNLAMANRHGLITGATGTGKTVTLQLLAEHFSRAGIPVFTADIKGDLSGIVEPSNKAAKVVERLSLLNIEDFAPRGNPAAFWDLLGKNGLPVRTTISEIGPLLMARMLNLNDTQEAVLALVFKIADDQSLALLDIKDLRALLTWVNENASELRDEYVAMAKATLGAIQRSLITLEEIGGDSFFAEPALNIKHLMQRDFSGQGVISILDATDLINTPRLYATFLLWLLSEIYEELDEVGDATQPRFVFFFDEAHLLFREAPTPLLEKIEQIVRLIRSKGVGVYFATQHPQDVPDRVLSQLGNRFQHALRAFTPSDQKAVKTAAQTFFQNPNLNTEEVISQLAVGEALISVLDLQGKPTMVERTLVIPPSSQIGPIRAERREQIIQSSPMSETYKTTVDRESAYEILKKRRADGQATLKKETEEKEGGFFSSIFKSSGKRQGAGEALVKSILRSIGSTLGREISRGILGTIGGKR